MPRRSSVANRWSFYPGGHVHSGHWTSPISAGRFQGRCRNANIYLPDRRARRAPDAEGRHLPAQARTHHDDHWTAGRTGSNGGCEPGRKVVRLRDLTREIIAGRERVESPSSSDCRTCRRNYRT